MKLSNLLVLVCFVTNLGIAQINPVFVLDQSMKDTLLLPNHVEGGMPNSLKNYDLHFKMKLKGNNQLGFDIYESELDKMIVLIPDPTNRASLGMSSSSLRRLAIMGYPSIQQYQNIPLTRPLKDSLFIPDFNMKPFDTYKKKRKN